MTQFMLERLLTWKGLQLMALHNWAGTNAVPTLASFSSVPSCPFDNLKNSWHSLCFYFLFYFTITSNIFTCNSEVYYSKSQNISSDFRRRTCTCTLHYTYMYMYIARTDSCNAAAILYLATHCTAFRLKRISDSTNIFTGSRGFRNNESRLYTLS